MECFTWFRHVGYLSELSCTITNREVQNLRKHICSATTAENRLKKFSAVEIVNPLNAIPIFWRAKIKQALLPEGCRRDKSKSCRSAKRVTFVTHVLAEPIRSSLHSESVDPITFCHGFQSLFPRALKSATMNLRWCGLQVNVLKRLG